MEIKIEQSPALMAFKLLQCSFSGLENPVPDALRFREVMSQFKFTDAFFPRIYYLWYVFL